MFSVGSAVFIELLNANVTRKALAKAKIYVNLRSKISKMSEVTSRVQKLDADPHWSKCWTRIRMKVNFGIRIHMKCQIQERLRPWGHGCRGRSQWRREG